MQLQENAQRYACLAVALVAAALAGCATYSPLPLDQLAAPRSDAQALDIAHTTPSTGLSLDDVVRLTLEHNPDLIAARAQRGVAHAQMVAAGVLPNPSINASYGFLISGPGSMAALAAGITQDITSLVTLSSRRRTASRAEREVDAKLLWQEWQTVAKARLLAVDIVEGEKLRALLADNLAQLRTLLERNRVALARGDTTLLALVPDLSATAASGKLLDDFERQQAARRRDLNVLLGLDPAAPLPLTDRIALPPIDSAALVDAERSLAQRRPDLVALQLGYQAQEEKVRGAVLAQFPLFSLGLAGGRDTSDVRTLGPQVTFELPIFNRNQGNIAIETATRQQLHDEFTARLLLAKSEIRSIDADMAVLRAQLDAKRGQARELALTAANAERAHRGGDLDERTYVDVLAARNGKQQEVLALEQTLLEQQIALETLIGAGLPQSTSDALTEKK